MVRHGQLRLAFFADEQVYFDYFQIGVRRQSERVRFQFIG
jgi:hypothetical protein